MLMKNFLLTLLVFACFNSIAFAQPKYGKVSVEDLQSTSYPQDTTAVAVVLLKDAQMRFVYDDEMGFKYQYTLKTKIKILKTEGLDWCNQQISFYDTGRNEREDITGLSGTTYNLEDGKVVKTKMSKENIFDEAIDKKRNIRKFTLPGAKVGSIIEYNFTIVSPYFYELQDFYFQSSIPVEYVSFEVTIPEYFRYNLNMQGYVRIDTKKEPENIKFFIRNRDNNGRVQSDMHSCSATKYTFKGENVPAIKGEEYLWTINNYISKVSFELSQTLFPYEPIKNYSATWESIDKKIFDADNFGGNLKKTGLFKNEIEKQEPNLENASAILETIKSKVKWNNRRGTSSDNVGDALKRGAGSAADMNFLLYNALKAGGFNVYPVILSTRENGLIPFGNPSLTAFNNVIVGLEIDTLMYFADASSKYGSWNILPRSCLVSQARILKPNGASSWVDLTEITKGSTVIKGEYKFEGDEYTGRIQRIYREGDALSFKNNYFDHKDKDEYIEKLAANTLTQISNFEIEGLDEAGVSIKNNLVEVRPEMMLGDEYIYINPMFQRHITSNPFKSETRELPVMFGTLSNYRQMLTIEIPEDYEVEELPTSERVVYGNNILVMSYIIHQLENKIVLNYQFYIKELIILPEQYAELKDFFAKMVNKNAEQIVLKKI